MSIGLEARTVGSLLAITCPIVVLTPAPALEMSLSNSFICVSRHLYPARASYVFRLRLMRRTRSRYTSKSTWESLLVSDNNQLTDRMIFEKFYESLKSLLVNYCSHRQVSQLQLTMRWCFNNLTLLWFPAWIVLSY